MSNRGHFIVIEGLDRTGKTTQTKILQNHLIQLNKSVELIRFPDRTTSIGKIIDSYLRQDSNLDDHVIHLLFAANRWEKSHLIQTTLESGKSIISDRYAFSGIAFTAAKAKLKQPPESESIITLTSPDQGLPLPDLVIYLTLNDQSATNRSGFGLERYENLTLQEEVGNQFNQLVRPYFESLHGSDRWINVDASGTIEQVENRIWDLVKRLLLDSNSNHSIGKLWLP